MAELKQGTKVKFTTGPLEAYLHDESGELVRTERCVYQGDVGFWISSDGDSHTFGSIVGDVTYVVPGVIDAWFKVLADESVGDADAY